MTFILKGGAHEGTVNRLASNNAKTNLHTLSPLMAIVTGVIGSSSFTMIAYLLSFIGVNEEAQYVVIEIGPYEDMNNASVVNITSVFYFLRKEGSNTFDCFRLFFLLDNNEATANNQSKTLMRKKTKKISNAVQTLFLSRPKLGKLHCFFLIRANTKLLSVEHPSTLNFPTHRHKLS